MENSMSDRLKPGESLATMESITSPNTRYKLVLQADGNLVLNRSDKRPEKTQWASNTANTEVSKLIMQQNGNLVLSGSSGILWSSNTGSYPNAYVCVQDDGNVVIYAPDNHSVWETKTGRKIDLKRWVIDIETRLVTKWVWLGILILIVLGVGIDALSYTPLLPSSLSLLSDLGKGIGIGLVVAAITTGLVSLLILRAPDELQDKLTTFVKEDVITDLDALRKSTTEELVRLQENVNQQTKDLVHISESLLALDAVNIARVYMQRSNAASDIIQDLKDPALSEIQIIGISLNDFVPDASTKLHEVWKIIEGYIFPERSPLQRNSSSPLDIKVLLIDPNSYGAALRSRGENRESDIRESRLTDDIIATAKPLLKLEQFAKERYKETKVSFQFRFYQLPPQVFLFRTNKVSYVEPYYFWASRSLTASMPVFRCNQGSDASSSYLHNGMGDHFNLIWEKASISSEQLFEQHYVGINKGMLQYGAVNVYSDATLARKRMMWHLQNATKRVYIQGISLHSFFDESQSPDNLYSELRKLVGKGLEVRLLLLDPESEQATYRAFRERLLRTDLPLLTFSEFQNDQQWLHRSRLYLETRESIEQARRIAGEESKNFHLKLYRSAPSCFLLLVDDTVMVEQFQYGKVVMSAVNPILGKDMPLIEYVCEPVHPFETNLSRNSFKLMEDHFNFTFEQCADYIDSAIGANIGA
jgi:hypothetical protein